MDALSIVAAFCSIAALLLTIFVIRQVVLLRRKVDAGSFSVQQRASDLLIQLQKAGATIREGDANGPRLTEEAIRRINSDGPLFYAFAAWPLSFLPPGSERGPIE